MERVVGWLIPPACREETLGDLRERNGSTREFLGEASHVVPCVIVSRIRRTSDPLLLLMEAVALYTSFFVVAWWLERSVLYSEWGLLRLAIPPAVMLLTLRVADAYSDPRKRRPVRTMLGVVLATALALASQSARGVWALPRPVMVWGWEMGMLLVSTMRMMFPPVTNQAQVAKIPAFWLKMEAVPLPSLGQGLRYVLLIVAAVACYAVLRMWR